MNDYCVYKHIFPNGKLYIGISNSPKKRWRNGNGYKVQTKMAKAIKHYGWDNIKHEIICDGLTIEQAKRLEQEFIIAFDTIENGYNTSVGGDNITTTYLNPHILSMIRESHKIDEKYGEQQLENDIVSVAEKAKNDKQLADVLNKIDEIIENEYPEYKSYSGQAPLVDLHERRIDCYWWYMAEILQGRMPQKCAYQSAWFAEFMADINK